MVNNTNRVRGLLFTMNYNNDDEKATVRMNDVSIYSGVVEVRSKLGSDSKINKDSTTNYLLIVSI